MFAQVTHLCDSVYWLTCTDQYQLAMLCWRVQELFDGMWAEDSGGRVPELLEYMEWYVSERKKGVANFDYAEQWGGYNLDSEHVRQVYHNPDKFEDFNKYDKFMTGLLAMIEADVGDAKFAIVGTLTGDLQTLKHELAHAFYHTRPSYRRAQQENLIALKPDFVRPFTATLRRNNYAYAIMHDETQAYLSTDTDGLTISMNPRKVAKAGRPFKATLEKELRAVGLDGIFKRGRKR